jgi:hypothetical protein
MDISKTSKAGKVRSVARNIGVMLDHAVGHAPLVAIIEGVISNAEPFDA